MIKKCHCKSEYQDKKYGKQKRVHNKTDKSKFYGKVNPYRCTVYGTERD